MTGHSEDLKELAAALAKAQAAFPAIEPDGTGQVGQNRNYKYATLAHVLAQTRKALAENGLVVTQTCEPSGPTIRLTTTLLHTSGQYLSGTAELPLSNATPQGYGSAMTYARRYSLSAILGIASEDDDDGHEASQGKPRQQPAARARAEAPAVQTDGGGQQQALPSAGLLATTTTAASDGQWRAFYGTLKGEFSIDGAKAKEILGVQSLKRDLPNATFGMILQTLRDKRKQAAGEAN